MRKVLPTPTYRRWLVTRGRRRGGSGRIRRAGRSRTGRAPSEIDGLRPGLAAAPATVGVDVETTAGRLAPDCAARYGPEYGFSRWDVARRWSTPESGGSRGSVARIRRPGEGVRELRTGADAGSRGATPGRRGGNR